MQMLYIAVGGMAGTVLRYLVTSGFVARSTVFPWGTLTVNLLGSFLAGLCFGLLDASPIALEYRLMIVVGFLGAFTTFSTFSTENFYLLRSGQWGMASLNIVVSNVLGIAFVFLGFALAMAFIALRGPGS